MNVRDELIERFFRYAAIESQSDERALALPSTAGQHELATVLATELRDMCLDNVVVDQNAIVTAVKKGNRPGAPRIGFIAHLDTVNVGLSASVRPQIKRFVGDDICLNREQNIWFRVNEHPQIQAWRDEDIIFSDGTSVLGADNKAAIAVIMTLLSRLGPSDAHGDLCIAFVPDEEIGLRGAKALDLTRFPCEFAYTIDCCELGEVVTENFNAASGEVIFTGVSAHPMSAKGVLVNPLLMALDFVAQFDREDTPECTDAKDGFFWFNELKTNDCEARLSVLVRDFDMKSFEGRKQRIRDAVNIIKLQYPRGDVTFEIVDTYRNIGESLDNEGRPIELLLSALRKLAIQPKLIPMRGGTDGAVLSARGLTTPNFFTGAYNFHSRFEFLPVPAFEKSFQTALMICALAAR
jgi:tripeptide aminopeptidase